MVLFRSQFPKKQAALQEIKDRYCDVLGDSEPQQAKPYPFAPRLDRFFLIKTKDRSRTGRERREGDGGIRAAETEQVQGTKRDLRYRSMEADGNGASRKLGK